MKKQWIAAQQALNFVADSDGSYERFEARVPLCTRAYHGKIDARADLLVVYGSQPIENANVPPSFWWAKGNAALTQDWLRGDFSTTERPGGGRGVEALGVEFELEGVLALLAPEARTAARLHVSAAPPDWLSASDAVRAIATAKGLGSDEAALLLTQQAAMGKIVARAGLSYQTDAGGVADEATMEAQCDVSTHIWQAMLSSPCGQSSWETGTLAARLSTAPVIERVLVGVHFLKSSLDASVAPTPAIEMSKPAPPSRPPAAWWDDLWCDLWGAVYRAEFQPQVQGDAERWMMNWAENRGHKLGESTARLRARRMFIEYEK